MSALTRRLFLRNAASAAPAVALVTGTGAVLAAAAETSEDAELLALEKPLHDAAAGFRDALRLREVTRQRLVEIAPDVPDEIRPIGSSEHALAAARTDRDGDRLLGKDGRHAMVLQPYYIERALKDLDGRTREARSLRARLAVAEAFDAADEHAYETSGFKDACYAAVATARRLAETTKAIQTVEARTFAGLALKAQAAHILRKTDDHYLSRFYVTTADADLAAAVLAVAKASPITPVIEFDYPAAIAKLESMGVQLSGVAASNGRPVGFHYRRNGVPEDTILDLLASRRGYDPFRMGEVLIAQGKVSASGTGAAS